METDETDKKSSRLNSRAWVWIGAAILGAFLIFLLATPNFVGNAIPLSKRRATACINNLRAIDGAKQTRALETNPPTNATPTWDNIKPYLFSGGTNAYPPGCPDDGVYTIGNLQTAPTCSIKVHTLE